ncbi:MAG: aminotransferase class IV [bacterium]
MTDRFVWWNGRVMRPEEARLDPRDRAVLYGVGLFETLRAYHGVPFALDAHLRRLRHGAARLRLALDLPTPRVRTAIRDLVEACDLARGDAFVRITVTGGLDGGGIDCPSAGPPSVLIHARPVVRRRSPAVLRACRASPQAHRAIPAIKSIGYLPSALARRDASQRGCDEALVLSERDELLEGANSTILVRSGTRLITPPLDGRILPGITRRIVLDLARAEGWPVEERCIPWLELVAAREVMSVASVREIAAIVSIEGRTLGAGVPGEWTRRLFRRYRERALGRNEGSAASALSENRATRRGRGRSAPRSRRAG